MQGSPIYSGLAGSLNKVSHVAGESYLVPVQDPITLSKGCALPGALQRSCQLCPGGQLAITGYLPYLPVPLHLKVHSNYHRRSRKSQRWMMLVLVIMS